MDHRLVSSLYLWWLCIVLSLTMLLLLPVRVAAADPSIRFDPAVSATKIGETVVIEVRIEDVEDLFGADIRLRFDPTLMQALDANDSLAGVQVDGGSFPYPDFSAINDVDNSAGEINYVVTQLSPREPLTGSGVAFSIEFEAIDMGTCYLDVTYGVLVRMDGVSFEADLIGGTVQINSSSGATPYPAPATASLTPTASPTPRPTFTPTQEGVLVMTKTWTPKPTFTAGPTLTLTRTSAGSPTAVASPSPTPASAKPTPTPNAYSAPDEPAGGEPTRAGGLDATSTPGASSGSTATQPPAMHLIEPQAEATAVMTVDSVPTTVTPVPLEEEVPSPVPTPHGYHLQLATPTGTATPAAFDAIAQAGRKALRCLWWPLLLSVIVLGLYLRLKERFPDR